MIVHYSDSGGFAASSHRRVSSLLALALGLAVCVFAGCGGGAGKGAVAGKDPVKKVIKAESNLDALAVWTANKAKASVLVRFDPSDDLTVFAAANMQDMENTAGHLKRRNEKVLYQIAPLLERGGTVNLGFMAGMYERVIWVVPSLRPVGDAPVDAYRNFFIQQRRFPASSVVDFKKEGAFITGTVAGVPLTIARLADLSLGEGENAIIDIDISYFPALKTENRSYQTGTRALLNFLRELGSKGIRTTLVTVNLSSQTNTLSMDLRYFDDVIEEGLTRPESITGPVPQKWELMIEAEDSLVAKRYAAAEALYSEVLKTDKEDSGVYFALAIAQGYQNKSEECRASLLSAYGLDSVYLRGLFQLARVLGDAGAIDTGIEIIDMPELAKIVGPIDLDYQRGLFFYSAHRPFDAITYLVNVARQRPKEFGLFTILFKAYRDAGDDNGQRLALQKLVDIDEGRVRREMPWVYADLGQVYDRLGYYGNASENFEKYIQMHPDDSLSKVFQKKLDAWKAKGLLKPKAP